MARRRRTNSTPELLPDFALERMPAPIQEAQAKAQQVADARNRGRQQVVEARGVARDASAVDAEAVAKAARSSKQPPAPTEPQAKQQKQAAEQALGVLERDYEDAVAEFHRVLIKHVRDAIAAQQPTVAADQATAVELLDQLAVVVDRLSTEAGVLGALATADEHTVNGRGKVRYQRVGRLRFDGPRRAEVDHRPNELISNARAAIEALGREVVETVGETQEREQQEREQRKTRLQGVGDGVHVPAA
jgi:hypothetical protein